MDDLDLGQTLRGFAAGQKVFGRYTLTRLLGRGGMGVVWLARDEKLEQEVALKFLPETLARDEEAIADLKRETRKALRLTHPRIVRIYDFVEDSRCAGIAMEFVDGRTLTSLKLEQPDGCFSVETLRPWMQQLCEALDYAHAEAKVAHRDLKPANLMVDGRGGLKIADFGISATLTDTATRASRQASSSGTPVYMSPQQMMGEKPAATDDIYSLGATLYELLTGKPPFYSGNILLQVQNKVPPSIAERRAELGVTVAGAGGPGIPPAWEATIASCLAKQPQDRPQSAAEVWRRLNGDAAVSSEEREARRAEPEPSVPPTQSTTSRESTPPRPRTRLPLAIGLAALLAVSSGMGWYYGIEQPAQRREQILRQELAREAEQKRQAELARLEAARAEAEQARKAAEERAAQAARQEAEQARLAAEREATAKRPITIPGLNLELLPIPAGSFAMGSTNGDSDEKPVTQVELTRAFWLGKTEVTQGQWEAVMGNNPSMFEGANLPVERVNYDDALEFCRKLTARERAAGRLPEGYEYTLPTEAQWEYACRAGTMGDYAGGLNSMGWYDGNSGNQTHTVGQKQANAWGLYDMHGNVWEWCLDWGGRYRGGSVCDPAGTSSGMFRVVRGGSWDVDAKRCCSAHRRDCVPDYRVSDLGFRLALSSVP
jgi:formylglycine-generating enzyme required for sulfatase activity/serine/threonine protein kinase